MNGRRLSGYGNSWLSALAPDEMRRAGAIILGGSDEVGEKFVDETNQEPGFQKKPGSWMCGRDLIYRLMVKGLLSGKVKAPVPQVLFRFFMLNL